MTRNEIEASALANMEAHFNCAESVLRGACHCCGLAAPTRVATCFGGGVGRSKSELCGALAGGLMALGLSTGRDAPEMSSDRAQDLAAEFRRRFIEHNGSSICGVLLERFGEQKDWERCKRLTAETAGLLFDLLRAEGGVS
ncbi:C-GCAxxG-C-C family protein [Desulfovibrio aminophilus]|nr:C-GCAxxG-C-C family protein [Desulfovibrio aminophilus]MCM0755245.1 C-GCAxxG-C-C family protein [Desulfovibrio aminophilus]